MASLDNAPGEEIDKLMDTVPPESEGLRVWPFLSGTASAGRPASGRIYGLRLSHGRAHLLRATVEGLCLELARQIGWLVESGCPVHRLIMCGGGARSRCTPQIVADVTNRPVRLPAQPEIGAFGAAILARAMLEENVPLEELFGSMAGKTRELQPGPAAAGYAEMLAEYVNALPAG
jgi:sugar (pentulose or hexulose) kinase